LNVLLLSMPDAFEQSRDQEAASGDMINRVITVGRRSLRGRQWDDQDRLAQTAAFLHGDPALVPGGVFRFSSLDEANAWMARMMIVTHERRRPPTSSASAGR